MRNTLKYLGFIHLYHFINRGNDLLTASLPGMWERTITIGSGGKTFSATGWKVPVFLAVDFKVSHLYSVYQMYSVIVLSCSLCRLAGPSALGILLNT